LAPSVRLRRTRPLAKGTHWPRKGTAPEPRGFRPWLGPQAATTSAIARLRAGRTSGTKPVCAAQEGTGGERPNRHSGGGNSGSPAGIRHHCYAPAVRCRSIS
jgi:hypothetical protein